MKKMLILILGILFLVSCTPNPSDKQIEFANKLLENPAILETNWGTSLSLDVTVDFDALGINPRLRAQIVADEIAAAAEYSERNICTIILYGNKNIIAESCASYNKDE